MRHVISHRLQRLIAVIEIIARATIDTCRCHVRAQHLHDAMLQVIKLISQVIADFADGEIDQSMHKVSCCSACTCQFRYTTCCRTQ